MVAVTERKPGAWDAVCVIYVGRFATKHAAELACRAVYTSEEWELLYRAVKLVYGLQRRFVEGRF
ncbi:MAG: hypothetical protein JSW37_13265 [Anaerolineales bacterium]|nr:MAG: hypothetical protein JSW37_13265 [Anaerolineales bacterium]